MSLQKILFSNIFQKKNKGPLMDPPLAEVEKLFLFAVDQITDSVYAEKKFKFYLDAIKLSGLEQSLAMVKAYYACESAVIDKVKLRQDIRQKININLLDPYLRIIFLPELEQLLLLYEVFSKTLAEYLILNLGKERVAKIISSQRTFPLIKEVAVLDESFDFSQLNKILSNNKDLKKKDIEDLFSSFYHSLLTEISVLFGESTVNSLIRKTFEIVKSFYDFDIISLFLNIVPEGDLEEERLAFLSRDELEAKVHERTFLLKKEKELVDQKVKERTVELNDEKVKLAIVTENMGEGVILLDESYTVMYINPFAKRMFKMLTASNLYTNDILKTFSDKFAGVDLKASFEKAKETNFYEIPEIDSENKIYKIKFTLINNEKDKKYSLVWIEDITESKILERKKSEFVSVVAHQLRTPLSGIKWTLKMLLSGDLGLLTDDQKSFVGKAYDSNDRMISLINDMLNVDRIVSGRLQYFFVNIQFLDLVESVIYELMPFANKRKVAISFKEKPAVLSPIFIDPEKMRAVVQNLLENAIKYTKEDGCIRVILIEKSDTIYFEVQDNGIGIPPAEQTNIFTRFFRSTNAVRVQTDGSGLGLFISKSIIETHHGTIGFKSELGKGSSFYFEIPKQFKNNTTTNNNVVGK